MIELEGSTTGEVKVTFSIKDIYDILKDIKRGIKRGINDKIIISKSKISNLQFVPPESSTLEMVASSEYKYSFYVFHSISFEGDFGNNPDVFLIYSENDSEIKFDRKEQALMGDKLSVNKLNKIKIINDKYEYKLKEQMSYYSNEDSEYDTRPFIILVIGEESIGLATIILINKAFVKRVSPDCVSGTLPFTGRNPFTPFGKGLTWPNENELNLPITVKQLNKTFWLDDKYVNSIVALKDSIIKTFLNPKKQRPYKAEYLTESEDKE